MPCPVATSAGETLHWETRLSMPTARGRTTPWAPCQGRSRRCRPGEKATPGQMGNSAGNAKRDASLSSRRSRRPTPPSPAPSDSARHPPPMGQGNKAIATTTAGRSLRSSCEPHHTTPHDRHPVPDNAMCPCAPPLAGQSALSCLFVLPRTAPGRYAQSRSPDLR